MNPKSEEFKAAISLVREQIAAIKRRGTRSGYIGYTGCWNICCELIDLLEKTKKKLNNENYEYSYTVASIVLLNLARLALNADDSAGGVTMARDYVVELMEKVCFTIEIGSEAAEYIYLQSMKDCDNKVYDDWDEFIFDILPYTARLATIKNSKKMYEFLNKFETKMSGESYSSYHDEFYILTKLGLTIATADEDTISKYIETNLNYDSVRRYVAHYSLYTSNYNYAETLCLEKLNGNNPPSEKSYVSEWRYLLFDIYDKTGDIDKKIATAEDIMFLGDLKYYDILKKLLKKNGSWEAEFPILLDSIRSNLEYSDYMKILNKENMLDRLLEEVKSHPGSAFSYAKKLTDKYPTDMYPLMVNDIWDKAYEADNRFKYSNLCGLIKRLYKYGGIEEAAKLLIDIKEAFPKKYALHEELSMLAWEIGR